MKPKSAKEKKIEKVMREYKAGTLKSSSGKKVVDKDQAIAIAISEGERATKTRKKRKVSK